MSETNSRWSSTVVIVGCVAVLAAAFALGNLIGGEKDLGGPLTDGRRYKVPVSMSQPRRGSDKAIVTIVEWCDLQGEACKNSDKLTSELLRKYDGQVRHVWRHFVAEPGKDSDSSSMHELSRIGLEQAGKFWELRERFLARPAGPLAADELEKHARAVGLDWSAVQGPLEAHTFRGGVIADNMFASRFGVTDPATFYVNGRRLFAPVTLERIEALIEAELEHAKKIAAEGNFPDNDQLYMAIVKDGLFEPPLPMIAQAK